MTDRPTEWLTCLWTHSGVFSCFIDLYYLIFNWFCTKLNKIIIMIIELVIMQECKSCMGKWPQPLQETLCGAMCNFFPTLTAKQPARKIQTMTHCLRPFVTYVIRLTYVVTSPFKTLYKRQNYVTIIMPCMYHQDHKITSITANLK